MVWSLALGPVDVKQDPVVHGAEFGVFIVFLAKGPRTASIQEGLDYLDVCIRVLRESATFDCS